MLTINRNHVIPVAPVVSLGNGADVAAAVARLLKCLSNCRSRGGCWGDSLHVGHLFVLIYLRIAGQWERDFWFLKCALLLKVLRLWCALCSAQNAPALVPDAIQCTVPEMPLSLRLCYCFSAAAVIGKDATKKEYCILIENFYSCILEKGFLVLKFWNI